MTARPEPNRVATEMDAWRRERRAAALQWHPDRGGDADAFRRALAEVDARYARNPGRPRAVAPARRVTGLRRQVRGLARRVGGSLPRRRRYIRVQ